MNSNTGRDSDKFMLRLPDGMRDRIKRHAEANKRSMNAEIISLLDVALWEADWTRIEAGMEPLRETTPEERDMIERNRAALNRRVATVSETERSAIADELSLLDEIDSLQSKFKEVVDGLQRLSSIPVVPDQEDKEG
ncbi:Arc family DNA-binding protein [Sinorhizobium meliloti]|uniref:Arc family DNA-binding protein n=1 Tax=Rhizobium meliloti TaxID=382 RepID=UPI001296C4A9|nr:Arc family DNA-binding protein [Sinorhizobium meliloti]MDW9444812.1 Arc family DNA-binding protein [Sinorhizobium meliloti]MDW9630379.1 Arc family DNA-binding protein [Sinorhizobium meliloti]MQX66301.1 Arc family DNA-binding protein [Sinorhizobium meliloti]